MGARSTARRRTDIEQDWVATVLRNVSLVLGACLAAAIFLATVSHNPLDTSMNTAGSGQVTNWIGALGASLSDFALQAFGFGAIVAALVALVVCVQALREMKIGPGMSRLQWACAGLAFICLCALLSSLPRTGNWSFAVGLGGLVGDAAYWLVRFPFTLVPGGAAIAAILCAVGVVACTIIAFNLRRADLEDAIEAGLMAWASLRVWWDELVAPRKPSRPMAAPINRTRRRRAPAATIDHDDDGVTEIASRFAPADVPRTRRPSVVEPTIGVGGREPSYEPPVTVADHAIDLPRARKEGSRLQREAQPELPMARKGVFELPRLDLLARPRAGRSQHDHAALKQNAHLLMSVLSDFGVRGEIVHVRPGPVVTLYELKLASGVKAARVIGLADDIARSMSAVSCRVSQVKSRGVIGIELPNARRDTVYLQSILASKEFEANAVELPLALGDSIGGEPTIVNLAKMPHLLIAGTTGSGKSVGVNAMILSLLYKLTPDQCRFIMIDPKMLELSVYDGIPHLLAPVVTDPKKAVCALKWTVREMESRYELMSKIGVRNITGFNEKAEELHAKGEKFSRSAQTGWDRETGRPIIETIDIELKPFPYIVVVIDEMADLMLVAGKEIEVAVQRLAQMARAAGIHLIMATQRPSVDVITGTIKANFPTRISYTVTSKIDSRTILGEQGAEQLLGQGDLLYMAQGGGIKRLHGPFVSDGEVEAIVAMLKAQGSPEYFEDITADTEDGDGGGSGGGDSYGGSGNDLFDQAVAIVAKDRKASTSYIQRRLQIGYNRAANLIEEMEAQGMISRPNHAGVREVLLPDHGGY
jgi:DNA segregation ATPase FtsK/SpoIIIE, S-DNA-T family